MSWSFWAFGSYEIRWVFFSSDFFNLLNRYQIVSTIQVSSHSDHLPSGIQNVKFENSTDRIFNNILQVVFSLHLLEFQPVPFDFYIEI